MEEKIRQILSDLNAARRTGKQFNRNSFSVLEESTDDLDYYFGSPQEQLLHEILGIAPAYFPTYNALNERQLQKVNASIERCLMSWNILVDLPRSFPADKKYQLLVSSLNRKIAILKFGFVHLDFCDQDVEKCPLGPSYCSCLHYFKDPNVAFAEMDDDT